VIGDTQVGNRLRRNAVEFSTTSGEAPRVDLPEALPVPIRRQGAPPEDALGEPIGMEEVARLIGCSVWTVRYRLLRQGLPHFRVLGTKKLIFYRNQVVRWILEKQKERR